MPTQVTTSADPVFMFLFWTGVLCNIQRSQYPSSVCCPVLLTFDLPVHNSIPLTRTRIMSPSWMKHYCIRVEHNAIAAAAISSGLQSRPSFSQRFTQQHLRLQTVNSRRSSGSMPPLSLPMFSFHRAKNQYCLPCPCSACAVPCSICFSLILRSPERCTMVPGHDWVGGTRVALRWAGNLWAKST